MADPYLYQYGGGGILGGAEGSAPEVDFARETTEAQAMLDSYNPEGDYAEIANKSLYVMGDIGTPTISKGDQSYFSGGSLDKLSFSQEQIDSLFPAMKDAYGLTHGGINIVEVDKAMLQAELDSINSGSWAYSDTGKYDVNSQLEAIYHSGAVGGGRYLSSSQTESEYDMDGPSVTYLGDRDLTPEEEALYRSTIIGGIHEEETLSNYKSNLEMLLADDSPYFAYYSQGGEEGSFEGYEDMVYTLKTAAEEGRANYLTSAETQIIEQQGILDSRTLELQEYKDQQTADVQARSDMWASLFNTRSGGYM